MYVVSYRRINQLVDTWQARLKQKKYLMVSTNFPTSCMVKLSYDVVRNDA